MYRSSNESSVDPEDVEATIQDDRQSVSYTRSQQDSESSRISLSCMSDLENDAVPFTPVSPHPPPVNRSTDYWKQFTTAPEGGVPGQPQQDRDAPGLGGSGAIPVFDPVSQPVFIVESSGACFRPKVDQAFPDDLNQLRKDPSEDSLASLCSNPKHEPYDAVIISHLADLADVQKLKQLLSDLVLYDGKPARVAVEDDDPDLGKGEIKYFEQWLDKAEIMLMYTSKTFCTDLQCNFNMDVAIIESFFVQYGKKEFVIPVFLENKYKCRYMSPCIRAIKGIDYIGCEWTERVAKKFKINLDAARKRRKARELQKDMAGMKLED